MCSDGTPTKQQRLQTSTSFIICPGKCFLNFKIATNITCSYFDSSFLCLKKFYPHLYETMENVNVKIWSFMESSITKSLFKERYKIGTVNIGYFINIIM